MPPSPSSPHIENNPQGIVSANDATFIPTTEDTFLEKKPVSLGNLYDEKKALLWLAENLPNSVAAERLKEVQQEILDLYGSEEGYKAYHNTKTVVH